MQQIIKLQRKKYFAAANESGDHQSLAFKTQYIATIKFIFLNINRIE